MELQTLAQKSIELHRKFKTLELQLKAANADLLDAMIAENVSTIKVKQRTVSLVTRNNKDFGDDINQQELLLKAEKKRLEVLGQFTIASTSQSIRINWHSGGDILTPILSTFHHTLFQWQPYWLANLSTTTAPKCYWRRLNWSA